MQNPIRVLIVDDHTIARKGALALLSTEQGIEVIGEAANGREAVAAAQETKPDVVLMDLVMPVMDGIEATAQIGELLPDVKVLVLTSFASDDKVFPAIKSGAAGYLLKDCGPAELVDAIRQVHIGQSWIHPVIARKLIQEFTDAAAPGSFEDPLTERELTVLRLVAQGKSNQEIADDLGISEATVRTHVSNILSKLHLASRTQAALYALKKGIASIE